MFPRLWAYASWVQRIVHVPPEGIEPSSPGLEHLCLSIAGAKHVPLLGLEPRTPEFETGPYANSGRGAWRRVKESNPRPLGRPGFLNLFEPSVATRQVAQTGLEPASYPD